ncbi:ribosome silencing factor [Amygdalobacter nucleatus]|uniref:Ribosomal silencing factor RsfS n=1 Tax=Amygdalobacter nucleatus TaxID=3029274 RepID=A0A133YH23_9FIRM|nr:ribosome silencing factor [Amygdalobacter nucleatus]KXB42476.1 iojap-like protein [Amygdalobacter nucleatus]MDF0486050.1 ribosome silencing factor [Amygdalobacter nucleatus]WEG37394.1 ribosome silencing factor [Amygdalobacter nucleatus]
MTAADLAKLIQQTLSDYKAMDVDLLDLQNKSSLCDYFVIASANSEQQAQGLSNLLEEELAKQGIFARTKEGLDSRRWILLDFDTVIVHIFHKEERSFYNLDKLWQTRPSQVHAE